ncbi:MAG: 50S ribosomal protein L18 [Candidatus Saccharibacteria bacterium]|nr:50S ribosomal protein L18 [Candidatus Saccharibacteria bacterium]
MNRLAQKLHNLSQRKKRVRSTVIGTTERPRLSVFVSNRHIVAQIIDDSKKITLVHVSTNGKTTTGTLTEKAAVIGAEVAKKAKAVKITKVVFDRNGKLYHGRVQALADAARKNGLEF